ncbi:MAG: tRNA (adenosine(37)-N6)-dimethylallyltransferase MiaA [Candidatus Riflebacteria bacterium]|nr:tRNA (adenosine(37)-N6)-dimethylallyltransferase MiaA [Candidatus Riflebacteria bacterium]
MLKRPRLVALLGPTASGKSSLALQLARDLGLEIVNCDSRQVYREMDIGTAKATPAERSAVPHHLLDLVSPAEPFSAGDYLRAARPCLENLWRAGRVPLLVGGTGFYFDALQHGLPEVPADEGGQERWQARLDAEGLPALVDELRRRDPEGAARIDLANPRRVLRALAIIEATGGPLAAAHRRTGAVDAEFLVLVGTRPRQDLWERIRHRVGEMVAAGLPDEAKRLLAAYGPSAPGLRAIGYAEWEPFVQGAIDADEVVRQIVIHTRQYAKRQETWFRKRPGVPLLAFDDPSLPGRLAADISRFLAG